MMKHCLQLNFKEEEAICYKFWQKPSVLHKPLDRGEVWSWLMCQKEPLHPNSSQILCLPFQHKISDSWTILCFTKQKC